MRKKFSKLIAVVLAAIICLSVGSIFACAVEKNMTLTVASVSSEAGKSVDVKIDLSNNVGLASLKFDVRYDSMLTLEKVTLCDDFTYATTPEPYKNPQTISFMSPLVETTKNGTVATLKFKISSEAPADYKAKVTLTYDPDDIFDGNMDNVYCNMVEGTVTVSGSSHTGHIVSTTLSQKGALLYGIAPGLTSLEGYFIFSAPDVTLKYKNNFDRIGTGSEVVVTQGKNSLESYTIILVGDIDGNGWYDGQDAVLVSMLANGMLTREQIGEAAYMAADCNHDGAIDANDIDLLNQAGALLSSVDQTLSTEEMLESAAYKEYLELIDQIPTAEKVEDGTTEDTFPTNCFFAVILLYLEKILNFIISLFKKT